MDRKKRLIARIIVVAVIVTMVGTAVFWAAEF